MNNYKDAFIALASSYYWLIIPKYIYLTGKWNYVEIEFSNNRLRKRFNEAKAMQKAFGTERAKRVQVVMTALKAAPNLGVLGPPYSPPHRCHELTGNRKGMLSLDLDGHYRLIVKPINDPLPQRPEGGLDWYRVTAIEITGVEDAHG
ncbi:MAG: killer suppression protein [Candidatus Sedimenticola endophacoides]